MATTYTFSARGNEIFMTYNDSRTTTTKTVDTGTLLTQDMLEERFFSDIIKDANDTDTTVISIQDKLRVYFPTKQARILPTVESQNRLKELERMLRLRPDISNNTRDYPNINRTSNAGADLKILDAKYALPESGKAVKDVCKNPNVISVRTAAAVLDSADKPDYNIIFNENILFDQTFTNRVGFVNNITWQTQKRSEDEAEVSINFGTPNRETAIVNIKNKNRGNLGKYVIGNKEKNGKINENDRDVPREDKIKYLIMKELGDVAQIWMYLAFNEYKLLKDPTFRTTESVMITTDSVVLTMCSALRQSCLYTGSRAGVKSGHCTLIHYSAGDVDYRLSFENDILNTKNHIEQHNESIRKFLNKLIGPEQTSDDKKKVATYYYVLKRGKLDRVNINAFVRFSEVNTLIQTTIRDIEAFTTSLKDLYEQFKTMSSRVTNNQQQKELHDRFVEQANTFKYTKFVTKVVKRDALDDKQIINSYYILHPGEFLTNLISAISIRQREREVSYPKNLQEILKHLQKSGESTIETLSGGKKKNKQSGGQLIGKYGSDYYECLLLCYIYMFFRRFNYRINGRSRNMFDDEQVDFHEDIQNIFALFYDSLAYDLNYFGQLIGLERCLLRGDCVEELSGEAEIEREHDIVSFEDVFSLGTDEDILKLGGKLSKYVYLAKDYGEELSDDEDISTAETTESYEGAEESKHGEIMPIPPVGPPSFTYLQPQQPAAAPQFTPPPPPAPITSVDYPNEPLKRRRGFDYEDRGDEDYSRGEKMRKILSTSFTVPDLQYGMTAPQQERTFFKAKRQRTAIHAQGGRRRKRTMKKISHKTIKNKQRKVRKQKKTRKQKNQKKYKVKQTRRVRK